MNKGKQSRAVNRSRTDALRHADELLPLEDRAKLRAVELEALRTEIQRGADSGAGLPAKAVFASVRERIVEVGAAGPGRR